MSPPRLPVGRSVDSANRVSRLTSISTLARRRSMQPFSRMTFISLRLSKPFCGSESTTSSSSSYNSTPHAQLLLLSSYYSAPTIQLLLFSSYCSASPALFSSYYSATPAQLLLPGSYYSASTVQLLLHSSYCSAPHIQLLILSS